MLWQLMFNVLYPKVQNIGMEIFIANKCHIESVDVLTDMFCSNQWRADRKQEIARVQGVQKTGFRPSLILC